LLYFLHFARERKGFNKVTQLINIKARNGTVTIPE
jgi:hypothetical protein